MGGAIFKTVTTHNAQQKGMLRCLDATTDFHTRPHHKNCVLFTSKLELQIDPAFKDEYELERDK